MDPRSMGDVVQLQQRLRMVTEWHERCEARIAELLRCPDHTRSLRPRVESAELAIPLLQSYDVALLEKDKELTETRADLARTKSQLEIVTAEARENAINVRVVSDKAQAFVDENHMKLKSKIDELAAAREQLANLQRELIAARENAIHNISLGDGNAGGGVESPAARDAHRRLVKECEAKDGANRELTTANAQLQRTVEALQAELAAMKQQQYEDRNEQEAQKVQLHLAARENDDKVQEIERLRDKMVHALKQAGENHATHLKLVEEKHRSVVEMLKQEAKQHELACMKLRAQLARADVVGGGTAMLSASRNGALSTASESVELHMRHALELELKRLYGELSSAQMQRDDALVRFEQLSMQRRQETQEALREATHDRDVATARAKDLEDRNGKLESELGRQRETVRTLREEIKSLHAEVDRGHDEKLELTKKHDESRRALAASSEEMDRIRTEAKERLDQELRNVRTLERRVEDIKRDEASVRERQLAESLDASRLSEELRAQLRDAHDKLGTLQAAVAEKDRLVEVHRLNSERLSQGLAAHKSQLQQCEQRIADLSQREAQLVVGSRDAELQLERAKLQHARLSRDRDRLASELNLLASVSHPKRRSTQPAAVL